MLNIYSRIYTNKMLIIVINNNTQLNKRDSYMKEFTKKQFIAHGFKRTKDISFNPYLRDEGRKYLLKADMAIYCWVPDCDHNNMKHACSFFRFPENAIEYSKWLRLIGREDEPGSSYRVCSCHFRDGDKRNGPELLSRNIGKIFKKHHLTPEKPKARKRLDVSSEPETTPSTSDYQPTPGTSRTSEHKEGAEDSTTTSRSMLEAENYLLKLQLEHQEKMIKNLRVHMAYEHICENDKYILEYTGLPTRHLFESVLELITSIQFNYKQSWHVQRLSLADQLLMTLMKMRQNFPHADLAFRFGVSQATVTNIVVTFIHLLHYVLYTKLMKTMPSRHKNKLCLPNCASSFTNCRVIIDCTDVFSAVPRKSMKHQRLTYSTYKHRNTLKGLVGVAPNGCVTFVSDLYPGSTSDKAIVKHCGLLNQLAPGDLVVADKGFLIKELLPSGVSLNIPPFLCRPQFTPEEVRRTRCIARARIHVERAIQRMKVYKILSFIPEQLFSYSSVIFKAVGALTNLQYPLIREVAQFYTDMYTVTDENIEGVD